MRFFSVLLLSTLMMVLSFSSVVTAESTQPSPRITEMVVTTRIVKGNPIDAVHRISSNSVKALYCFMRLVSESGEETTIQHAWYRDGEKVAEYTLPVKGKLWRTYSKKTVEKGLSGDWRVDAVDSEGKILKSVQFRMN